jgi:hypothetical protein
MTPVRYKGRLYARITRPCSRGTIGVLGSTRTHARLLPLERPKRGMGMVASNGLKWQVASGAEWRVAKGKWRVAVSGW